MPMLDTAEVVSKTLRHFAREAGRIFRLESQRRTAAAQQGGRFKDEIAPITTKMAVADKATGADHLSRISRCHRMKVRAPKPRWKVLPGLKPVREGGFITAGNASQLSDGASAAVIMSDKLAAKKGLKPLGIFRGFVVGRLRAG